MSEPRIIAKDLCIDFPMHSVPALSDDGQATGGPAEAGRIVEKSNKYYLRALNQLSFEIRSGERIGIWGKNGSGKTTLLRTLRGVYPPTSGELTVEGKTQSFFNLGFGLNENATGYENIMLRGVLMGATPQSIREKVEEIAEFTELGSYLDMPMYSYSAGMKMRVAFAVATALPSDILLMDEWISAGDAEFRKKVARRLQDQVRGAHILVMASHNMRLMEQVCTRIMTLSEGRIVDWKDCASESV